MRAVGEAPMLIEPLAMALLLAGTFMVAYFVAAIGPTGGLQLAVTTVTVPSQLVIPVHAFVSGFSALFRAVGLRGDIRYAYVLRFVLPSLAMTALAIWIGSRTGFAWVKLVIGAYIALDAAGAFSAIGARMRMRAAAPELSGLATGFITAFIGASGPLLWSLMQDRFDSKEQLSATHAACLLLQHFSKVALFGALGVAIFAYWPLLAMLLGASLAGTFLGQRRLRRFEEASYRRYLRWALIASGLLIVILALVDLGAIPPVLG